MAQPSSDVSGAVDAPLRPLPMLIFGSRWLQLPLYLGLIVAQCVYVFLFLKELYHLLSHANEFGEQQIMLVVLGLIDVVMISNLLVMVIVRSEEHTSELQSLMRISYAVFCLKKKKHHDHL